MRRLARNLRAISCALITLAGASAVASDQDPRVVSFATSDGGRIQAHLYGDGTDGVVLGHGAVFDKESWSPLAAELADRGHLVLALDFRGYGESRAGTDHAAQHRDISAALAFLLDQGASRLSAVGASRGANAVGLAAKGARPGLLSTVVLLAPGRIPDPESMVADRFVVIASESEPGVDRVLQIYHRTPEPKTLFLIDSNAHAQHLFGTDKGPELTRLIVSSLQR